MANWVDCLLIASGSKKDLKKMIRQSEMNKEDCSDEHLSDWLEMRAEWIDEPGFSPYSLDEECAEVQFAESCAAAFFKTAWDLPEYFFDNFQDAYPNLNLALYFIFEGREYAGKIVRNIGFEAEDDIIENFSADQLLKLSSWHSSYFDFFNEEEGG